MTIASHDAKKLINVFNVRHYPSYIRNFLQRIGAVAEAGQLVNMIICKTRLVRSHCRRRNAAKETQ